MGCDLVNATGGGEGTTGFKMPPELVELIRLRATNKKHTKHTKELIASIMREKAWNKGKTMNAEYSKRVAESNRKRNHGSSTRQSISEGVEGLKNNATTPLVVVVGNTKYLYRSMGWVVKQLGIGHKTIRRYAESQMLYNNLAFKIISKDEYSELSADSEYVVIQKDALSSQFTGTKNS